VTTSLPGAPVTHPLPPLVTERLRALRERPVEPADKGLGLLAAGTGGLTPASLAEARPALSAAGFSYPVLTLRESALAGNLQAMADFCAGAGVELAPHGKTSMSPELAARQLASGAWGITVATIGQLRTYRAFGFPRLLMANELVDEAGIAWLAGELAADPGFSACCYVDSADGVAILDRVLTSHRAGRRLPVLVEIGAEAGRTGCRTDEEALTVAKAAAATGTLTVAGVAGYEGSIHGGTGGQTRDLITSFCQRLANLSGRLASLVSAGDEFIVTAGGSVSFDIVARELAATGMTVILRSGGYLFHDHGLYRKVTPAARGVAGAPVLKPALELWAQVVSRPEPGLALLSAGRRDAGFDAGLPVPLRAIQPGAASHGGGATDLPGEITELNDQHAYLRLDPGTALAPGDLVVLGISHPCTTLDKWRLIPVLDDTDRITDVVHTFF
jgi:D-serine deaminase-like pyridoxal phosphate-dependent protein